MWDLERSNVGECIDTAGDREEQTECEIRLSGSLTGRGMSQLLVRAGEVSQLISLQASIDATGSPLTDEALTAAKNADAVILGAVGGPVRNPAPSSSSSSSPFQQSMSNAQHTHL